MDEINEPNLRSPLSGGFIALYMFIYSVLTAVRELRSSSEVADCVLRIEYIRGT